MKSSPIPKLSPERARELLARIEPPDPWGVAFTWDPKVVGESHSDLVELARIRTRHDYGAPALFKPSLAEVLVQIPDDLLDKVVAFQTFPEYDPAIGAMSQFTEDSEQHEATTVLYARV
jgi:hypothetical protein